MAVKSSSIGLWLTVVLLNILFRGFLSQEFRKAFIGFHPEPQDVVAVRNRPLLINCSVTGISPQSIEWMKDGVILDDASRHYVLRNGSLYFRRVIHRPARGRTDQGRYNCLVTDRYGKIASRPIYLTVVAGPPQISQEPVGVRVQVGELVCFQCATEAPSASITWERNRQKLPQNERYTPIGGVLQLSDINTSDSGKYRCKVNYSGGRRFSREAFLNVTKENGSVAPRLLRGPADVVRLEGEEAILECAVTGKPKPVITWAREDGKSIAGIRFSIVGEGNLRIRNIQLSDAANYLCKASIPSSGQSVTAKGKLTVHSVPRILEYPDDITKPAVSTIRFSCSATGVPLPTITWYKDGQPLDGNRIKYDPVPNRSELVIVMSKDADSGYYQCRAESSAGYAQATGRLIIKTSSDAPDPPTGLQARTVSSTEIEVSWIPSPRKNNLPIIAYTVHIHPTARKNEEVQKVVDQTTVIMNQLEPFTNYTMYVHSYNSKSASLISSEHITAMTLQGVPLDVPKVTLTPVSASSIKVSWSEISERRARGIINRYKLIYREHGKASEVAEVISGALLEYTVTGLKMATEYDVRMLAGTEAGFTKRSEKYWPWTTGSTLGSESVSAHPPAVQLRVLNNTSMMVTWYPYSPEVVNITGYKISYGKISSAQSVNNKKETRHLDKSAHQCILTDLEPFSWYEVAVVATTENGEGQATMKTIKTQVANISSMDMTPFPPVFLEAEPINKTAIRVHWERPAVDEEIIKYSVRYGPVTSENEINSSVVKIVTSEDLHVTIGNLKAYTIYVFAVQSHSYNQTGPFSTEIRCKTLEGVPSAPQDVFVKLLGPSSVELTWTPPAQKNGVILSYIIHYAGKESSVPSFTWDTRTEKGTVTVTRFTDLHQNTVYNFKVQAATEAGLGKETKVYQIETRGNSQPYMVGAENSATGNSTVVNRMQLGILIGVTISVVCIVICITVIIIRHRCCHPVALPVDAGDSPLFIGNGKMKCGNGTASRGHAPIVRMNGNAHGPGRKHLSNHELDTFTPMLAPVSHHSQEHLDTKGGNGTLVNSENPVISGMLRQLKVGRRLADDFTRQRHQCTDTQNKSGHDTLLQNGRVDEGFERESVSGPDTCFQHPDHNDSTECQDSQHPLLEHSSTTVLEDSDPGTGSNDTSSYNTLESLPDSSSQPPTSESSIQGSAGSPQEGNSDILSHHVAAAAAPQGRVLLCNGTDSGQSQRTACRRSPSSTSSPARGQAEQLSLLRQESVDEEEDCLLQQQESRVEVEDGSCLASPPSPNLSSQSRSQGLKFTGKKDNSHIPQAVLPKT